MIRRTIILVVLMGGVLALAWFNPPPLPEKPVNPRFVKIAPDGRELGAWEGPWSCVLDKHTGLIWEVKSYAEDMHDYQCSFSWFDGYTGVAGGGSCFTKNGKSDTRDLVEYTNETKRCGIVGWRLPTEQELGSLLSETPLPGDLLIDRDYFPYVQRGLYWTSNAEVPLTGYFKRLDKGAISIDFKDGSHREMPYRDTAFVRLVADNDQ
ncbi:MAG: DUF1566 domain-containing protein [Xanthomonadales bacterium]|nr:DUF1566 domain-containing protein [Xanthomonadales bacterium]